MVRMSDEFSESSWDCSSMWLRLRPGFWSSSCFGPYIRTAQWYTGWLSSALYRHVKRCNEEKGQCCCRAEGVGSRAQPDSPISRRLQGCTIWMKVAYKSGLAGLIVQVNITCIRGQHADVHCCDSYMTAYIWLFSLVAGIPGAGRKLTHEGNQSHFHHDWHNKIRPGFSSPVWAWVRLSQLRKIPPMDLQSKISRVRFKRGVIKAIRYLKTNTHHWCAFLNTAHMDKI